VAPGGTSTTEKQAWDRSNDPPDALGDPTGPLDDPAGNLRRHEPLLSAWRVPPAAWARRGATWRAALWRRRCAPRFSR